jgi:hypothetical protein
MHDPSCKIHDGIFIYPVSRILHPVSFICFVLRISNFLPKKCGFRSSPNYRADIYKVLLTFDLSVVYSALSFFLLNQTPDFKP